MKTSITKDELARTLSIVSKGMSSRSTLPILSGIMISTTDTGLHFQTTDLEISIRSDVNAFVEESGSTVVSGKLFNDIVRSLPDAAISLTTENDNTLKVECGMSEFSLITLDPADFPHFPELTPDASITLPSGKLADMVHKVIKVVSKDESRAVLTGILFSLDGKDLKLVATDSYRLATIESSFETDNTSKMDIIIPGRVFDEMMRSTQDNEDVVIGVAENQIVFEFGTTTFISRKIEGNYPNYKQLIPSDSNATIMVDTAAFIDAVKRVSLLAQSHAPIKFSFSSDDQYIEITSQSNELGVAKERLSAEIVGENVEIGFNHQYILDGLSVISSGKTRIEVQSSLKPGIFKSEDEGFLYLAMPVRLG